MKSEWMTDAMAMGNGFAQPKGVVRVVWFCTYYGVAYMNEPGMSGRRYFADSGRGFTPNLPGAVDRTALWEREKVEIRWKR
jgi:hypothetical protein